MMKDVPSGIKKNWVFTEKKGQDLSDEGRGYKKRIEFSMGKKVKIKVMKDVPSGTKNKIEFLVLKRKY